MRHTVCHQCGKKTPVLTSNMGSVYECACGDRRLVSGHPGVNKPPSEKTKLEDRLESQLNDMAVRDYVREYKPIEGRRYRIDFAWPDIQVAVEVEGGSWSGGRHTTGQGFSDDCQKYNLLTTQGWSVLRYPSNLIKDGSACVQIKEFVERRRG